MALLIKGLLLVASILNELPCISSECQMNACNSTSCPLAFRGGGTKLILNMALKATTE